MGDALHTGGTTSGGAGVTSAREARLAQAGLLAVQGPTLLDARTGVLPGPGSTTLVTGTADTAPMAYAIAPHQWVTSRRTADGPYLGALDAVRKVPTTAAPGTGSRIDVAWVRQADNDPTILTPDAVTEDQYGVTQGVPSTGTPAKPPIPVGALELATVTVAAGATRTNGAGVTITNTAGQTAPRGARVPVRNQAEQDALTAFRGLEVYRLDTGQVQLCTAAGPPAWAVLFDPTGLAWQTPTLVSGIAQYTDREYPPIAYRREGSRVALRGLLSVTSGAPAGGALFLGQAPEWARPNHRAAVGAFVAATAAAVYRLEMSADGVFTTLYALPAGTFLNLSGLTYPLG